MLLCAKLLEGTRYKVQATRKNRTKGRREERAKGNVLLRVQGTWDKEQGNALLCLRVQGTRDKEQGNALLGVASSLPIFSPLRDVIKCRFFLFI
jgi:hypothetical protein